MCLTQGACGLAEDPAAQRRLVLILSRLSFHTVILMRCSYAWLDGYSTRYADYSRIALQGGEN